MSKIPFRVSDGLDGADIRAINIGYPKRDNMTDAVNVQFLIDENTIQHYDPKRKYRKNFAVIFNDRAYYALRDIPTDGSASAGDFNPVNWRQLRTDPNWINVSTTSAEGYQILVGSYISADPTYSDLDFVLPRAPQNGDTVVIKDVSGMLATKRLKVSTRDKVLDTGLPDYQLTLPKAMMTFTYDSVLDAGRGGWRLNIEAPEINSLTVTPTQNGTQMSNADTIFRRSATGKIKLILPLYANDGDYITTFDLDQMTSVNNVTLTIHPNSTASIKESGTKSMIFKTVGWGVVVYNQAQNVWIPWDGDEYEKWLTILPTTPASNITLIPSSRVLVAGKEGEINFTLPVEPAIGDTVVLSLRNASRGVKINIKTSGLTDKIFATAKMFGIPRLNEVTAYEDIVPVTEIKHVATGYGEALKFVYNAKDTVPGWTIAEQSFTSYMASSNVSVRNLPGLVAFATEAEVMKQSETNPSDETAVTPYTLSKKTALEDRRGIAEIATQDETNAGTDDERIVTPKKLHERTALEDRRGIAEIATQSETDTGTDDQRIVTPRKLAGRTATETRTGVIALVTKEGAKQSSRTTKGAGVNDFDDHLKAVTPKVLFEKTATETNLGMMFWATQQEVNNGTNDNVAVRPSTLQARTSTPQRTGLARMVDMINNEHLKDITESLDTNVFITPKALASRGATYDMDGITRAAKDEDITAGTDEKKYINPSKLKYFTDVVSKVTAPDADGLNITGTIWKGLVFKVDQSTETGKGTLRLATQTETDAGTIDDAIVTPKKLQAKKATQAVYGISRHATAAEAAAGVRDDVAITPLTMGSALNNSSEWGSTEVRRGSAYIASLTNDNAATTVWQGNDTDGSTRMIENYRHDFYAVSPRGLNTALQHYLPIKGKAFDTGLFDKMKSSQFMRSDIDTKSTGSITSDKNMNAQWFFAKGTPESTVAGSYFAFNKDNTNNVTDIVNNRNDKSGGFAFWSGEDDTEMKRVVTISGSGRISAEEINTSANSTIGGDLTVSGEINYKNQTLDDRFVNVTGDTMTGNLSLTGDRYIDIALGAKFDGKIRPLIRGAITSASTGHIAVGATSTTAGFVELGTIGAGNETVYARQRSANAITNTFTLLDSSGNTNAPKTVSVDKLIARSNAEGSIAWGNKQAKVNNDGDVFGSIWGDQYLSTFIKTMVDQKVDRKGDTITGDLTLKKDIIIEGSLKIKVGNKYLIIRPNAANETVSFDWENV